MLRYRMQFSILNRCIMQRIQDSISHPMHKSLSTRPSFQASTSYRPPHAYCSVKYQGFLSPYASPGTCIGTGTMPSNSFRSPWSLLDTLRRAGRTTPHSQLRQLSLGSFVARSLKSLPHALSEQLADPMYAQDLDGSSSDRTKSS